MADCILTGSGGAKAGETYSAGEVDTGGKWIDGRPVYRLIINNINTQNLSVALSQYISGTLDILIDYDAELYNSSTNNGTMLSTQSTYTYGLVNKNTQKFEISNSWGGVIKWAMIEYVKTA